MTGLVKTRKSKIKIWQHKICRKFILQGQEKRRIPFCLFSLDFQSTKTKKSFVTQYTYTKGTKKKRKKMREGKKMRREKRDKKKDEMKKRRGKKERTKDKSATDRGSCTELTDFYRRQRFNARAYSRRRPAVSDGSEGCKLLWCLRSRYIGGRGCQTAHIAHWLQHVLRGPRRR